MKTLKYTIGCLMAAIVFSSCFDDKGTYTYSPINGITIENIQPEYALLGNVDTLRINPEITSTQDGKITSDNPNYSFIYRAAQEHPASYDDAKRFVLDSAFTMNVDILLKIPHKNYICWLTVKDKRTELETTTSFKLKINSPTTEGWMVLCNEGTSNRVRMDMISRISEERDVRSYDMLSNSNLPALTNALELGYDCGINGSDDDIIAIFTPKGAYRLDPKTFASGPEYDMRYSFGDKSGNCSPQHLQYANFSHLIVDGNNDAYVGSFFGGFTYEFPVNTPIPMKKPTFKVSPHFAGDATSNTFSRGNSVLFYDITNGRFVGFEGTECCLPIPNPSQNRYFDYEVGLNKTLLYMESVRRSGTTAYSLFKDANGGKYWVYGIKFTDGVFEQEAAPIELNTTNAPGIDRAKIFAFASQEPYMFYAADNCVYEFDLIEKSCHKMLTFKNSEEITLLKFNLFRSRFDKPESYKEMEYRLIVGTTDNSIQGNDNSSLSFYNVPRLNGELTRIGQTYSNFAKIVDVVYREK
ncbi:MAG: PKD-like family lipoprotein [Odoribacter sp.]